MSALREHLLRRIAASGPLSVAEYMAECLLHPAHGYYSTGAPIGGPGDFITAPEISQIFGELLGLSLAQAWRDQGAPAPFILAELGPGRGTLMADLLRATRSVPGFHTAMRLHLVEASHPLRAEQTARLPEPIFHDHLADLPDGPLFLIANEFFDALPLRQAVRDAQGWRERVIGARNGQLIFGLTDPAPIADLAPYWHTTEIGALVEWHPALPALAGEIGHRIATHGGAALIVDYGAWGQGGDTLQAVRAHQKTDPLTAPGQSDLTAHVDFAALAASAAPARASAMTPQGVFLERLGATARAQTLARRLTGAALESHIAAHRRLTHPAEMGSLFKVIAFAPKGAPLPPGVTQ